MEKAFEIMNKVGEGMKSRWTRSVTNWTCICIASSVAFLESIHRNSIEPTVWPYMKNLDFDASESAFGFIQAGQALTNALASAISGWIADRIFDTRPQLIVGNFVAITAVFAYFFVEFDFTSTTGLFVTYNLLMGVAFGFLSVYRTFIAMETKEEERSKGFGIVLMAEAVGLLFAPLSKDFDPDSSLPQKTSIGFNTGSSFDSESKLFPKTSDGFNSDPKHPRKTSKIHPSEPTFPRKTSKVSPSNPDFEKESDSYDKVAFGVLTIAKIGTGLIMITFSSITALYAMNIFAWTSQELVVFQSALMIANGVVSTWCQFTPKVNVYLYNVFLFLASGLALPLINLNLDILVSKVLGPINQGIQQAIFNVAGLVVNIFGPLAFTTVYEASGPTLLWKFEIIVSGGCLVMMALFYRRMVSFSQRSIDQK
ncbi:hypothetical protein FO519_002235 [Halicephalobus sp. NKZ332]|nr:hypothetical protein FO519_002235 [Halicephalobus sp. NKZ332]